MPTQWQDQYTDLSNVNSGNELQNGDDILAEHVNVALENGAYAKKLADSKVLYEHYVCIRGTATTIKGVGFADETVGNSFRIYFKYYNKYNTPLDSVADIVNYAYHSSDEYILGGEIRIRAGGTNIDAGCFSAYELTYFNGILRIQFVTPYVFTRPASDFYYYIPVSDNDTNITISDTIRTLIA